MTRVLVTGATGFIGYTLCSRLVQRGYVVRATLRDERPVPAGVAERVVVGDIGRTSSWESVVHGADAVLRVAARAHVLHDDPANSHLYLATNAYSTQRLAEASARAGVRRFVYLSSTKVNGEEIAEHAYTPRDEPLPQDAYGDSKWLAEKFVMGVAARPGVNTVILRPPLVYGPRVRAHFPRLMRWVDRQWPLPLAAATNRRSLVSIWNLCDLLAYPLKSPVAPGRIGMVSDGEDLSMPELIRRIGRALGRRVRLLPVPVGVLRVTGRLLRRQAKIARLCGSLTVDVTQTLDELGWAPPVALDEGLARTVGWYVSEGRAHDT